MGQLTWGLISRCVNPSSCIIIRASIMSWVICFASCSLISPVVMYFPRSPSGTYSIAMKTSSFDSNQPRKATMTSSSRIWLPVNGLDNNESRTNVSYHRSKIPRI